MSRRGRLEARVAAINAANKAANAYYQVLRAFFEPLVGQQLFKATGGFLAKYEKKLPKLPYTHNLMFYRDGSDYSLRWVAKTNEEIKDEPCCLYAEAGCRIGRLQRGVLMEIDSAPEYRTDYTADEIEGLRKDYEQKKEIADQARSALYPFGESDR